MARGIRNYAFDKPSERRGRLIDYFFNVPKRSQKTFLCTHLFASTKSSFDAVERS